MKKLKRHQVLSDYEIWYREFQAKEKAAQDRAVFMRRRYKLHKIVRKNYRLNARQKVIFVPESEQQKALENRFVSELLKHWKYFIQLTI